MKTNRERGFTLIEVMVAGLFLIVFLMLFSNTLMLAMKGDVSRGRKHNVDTAVTTAGNHILSIGRLAGLTPLVGPPLNPRGCRVTGPPTIVQCSIDFTNPPTGAASEVRFRYDPAEKSVVFEQLNGATWEAKTTYAGIRTFSACGDNAAGCSVCNGGDNCTTTPDKMYQQHLANVALLPAPPSELRNRFFRFLLKGAVEEIDKGLGASGAEVVFQSGFYVRNPPREGDARLTYPWGGKIYE